ncbi:hypothetical protein FA13DRAFT_1707991 [Coprinellus micaceus]|uniref:Uncharacterized protein n=1 Tax=Coprinellus micaceus TaxID=71717 RepID=A0A4Y7TIH5_COPMI|nr:hypothetical protein FA13DRAFT_1707991 [Coprinellus micaceus]
MRPVITDRRPDKGNEANNLWLGPQFRQVSHHICFFTVYPVEENGVGRRLVAHEARSFALLTITSAHFPATWVVVVIYNPWILQIILIFDPQRHPYESKRRQGSAPYKSGIPAANTSSSRSLGRFLARGRTTPFPTSTKTSSSSAKQELAKSAIINMLREKSEEKLDDAIAVVSNAALGCTLVSTKYPCRLCDEVLMLWDTAGLVEGEFGNVTAGQAEDNLASLLQNMEGGGVSLLVYCIRARRFRTIIKSHYELFFEKTCGRAIPIVLVVTGLENEEFMEDWWVRNEREFRRRGIEFTGHACITSTRGKAVQGGGHVFDDEYEESVRHLQGAILSSATSANVQIAGSKASSWAPWTSSMQKTLSGGWKRLGKIGSGQIVDDTAAVVYTTTGSYTSYPPQSARVPAGTDAVTYPVHSSAKSRVTHSGQHPTRFSDNGVPTTTHTDGAAIASLAYDNAGSHAPHWGNRRSQHPMSGSHFSITSAPGITPVGNAVIHHQPPPTPGLHSRLPQMLKRASDASRTPAPALTQTETAQPDQRTAGPHPPQQAADFHGSFYLDNGQGPVPFHQEASDQT